MCKVQLYAFVTSLPLSSSECQTPTCDYHAALQSSLDGEGAPTCLSLALFRHALQPPCRARSSVVAVAVVAVAALPVTVEEVLAGLLLHYLLDGADPAAGDDAVQASHSRGRRPRRSHRDAVRVACARSEDARSDHLDARVVVHLRVRV